MTFAEMSDLMDRVEAQAQRKLGTGDADADSVLHHDAQLIALEMGRQILELKAIRNAFAGAIQEPSEDLAIHARQIVDALNRERVRAERLEETLVAAAQRAEKDREGLLAANTVLREKLQASEARVLDLTTTPRKPRRNR